MVGSSHFRELERLFLAAVELPEEQRASFLRSECVDDSQLLSDIQDMLDRDEGATFTAPAVLRECLDRVLDTTAEPTATLSQVGQYRILRRIGLGGMGAVYEAEQAAPQRRVALKVIRPDAQSKETLSRFRYEAELLGRLQHPGIAQILEAGTFDNGDGPQPFFAMEYVDGESLLDYAQRTQLPVQDRLRLMADVCEAVHHAHEKGVVHRDLKPDNIMVSADGRPKVLDFGVGYAVDGTVGARTALTKTGTLVGTLGYMSPEQIEGLPETIDARSDVYALGVILFELLTGQLPFDVSSHSFPVVARQICESDPPRLSELNGALTGDIESIVGMAMALEKSRRYLAAGGLASDLRRLLNHETIVARPTSTWYQVQKFTRRHKAGVVGVIATVLALLIGIVSTTVQAVRATQNAEAALAGEATARRQAYRANIAAASADLLLGDLDMSRRRLQEIPEASRQWEWRHLESRLDRTESILPLGESTNAAEIPLAFSGGEATLLEFREGQLRVLDAQTGRTRSAIEIPWQPVAMTLSPEAAWVAAVDDKNSVHVWEAATGRPRFMQDVRLESPPTTLRFSGDTTTLMAYSTRGFTLLDLPSGKLRARHRIEPPFECHAAAFDREARTVSLLVARPVPAFDPRIELLDGITGELLATRPMPGVFTRMTGLRGLGIAMTGDGSRIACTSSSSPFQIQILDGQTLAPRGQVGGHELASTRAAFTSDGAYLASTSLERIVLHDMSTLKESGRFVLPGLDPSALHWSPDQTRIVVAEKGREVRVLKQDVSFLELSGADSFIYVAAWSPDGSLIASGDWDGKICLWDARTGELLMTWPCDGFISMVAFSEDGAEVRAWADGVQCWDTATGLVSPHAGEHFVHEIHGTSPNSPWSTSVPGAAKYVSAPSGGHSVTTSTDASLLLKIVLVNTTDLSHEADASTTEKTRLRGGRLLPGDIQQLVLSDTATGSERVLLSDPSMAMRSVAISHDNRRVAVGFGDGTVRILDAATGEQELELRNRVVKKQLLNAHEGDVHCMEFSANGQRLIVGGDNARVVLWDLAAGEEVMALQPHKSYVHTVGFSPDETRILSGSGDRTLRIWDSVPLRERSREIREAEALRAELRPRVERMIDDLGDPAEVARRLRSDAQLDAPQRRAALRCLLERARPAR